MKRIISLLVSIVIVCSFIFNSAVSVSAAGRCVIALSQKNVEIGDTVTVTVSVSSAEAMYAVQFALKYDPDVLNFQSGDSCSGGAGVLTVVDALDGVKSKSLSYSFKATKAGSCTISTADAAYVNENYEEVSFSNQGATVRVKDIKLSSNAKLKSLKVSKGKLSPSFSATTTLYKVSVEKSVTDCNVYATAEDADAKVTVEGGNNLNVGENTCRVIVTAANGNQKIYKIIITRKKAAEKVESSKKEESSASKPTASKKPTSSKESVSSKKPTSSKTPTSSIDQVISEEKTSSENLDSNISEESSLSDVSNISEETDSMTESSELDMSSEEDVLDEVSSDINLEENDTLPGISVDEIEIVTENTESTLGKQYVMAPTLDGVDIPKGFEVSMASFGDNDVEVAKDKDGNYILYYLNNTKTKEIEPYVFDEEIQEFKKLQYIEQKNRYYIFAQVPSDFSLPSGYYLTGSLISDFNINCYASENPELSDFYYMYCFNGKDYEFYRYDTEEKVIQRYPELDMITPVYSEDVDTDGLISRFTSLTKNAKIVVLGTIALILFALILVILLISKILSKRSQAAMVNDWDYDSFDNVEIDDGFENEEFLDKKDK